MKILVTGAAGFIGYHLCYKLIDKDIEVIGFDNIPIKELFHFALVINGNSCEVYFNAKLI